MTLSGRTTSLDKLSVANAEFTSCTRDLSSTHDAAPTFTTSDTTDVVVVAATGAATSVTSVGPTKSSTCADSVVAGGTRSSCFLRRLVVFVADVAALVFRDDISM